MNKIRAFTLIVGVGAIGICGCARCDDNSQPGISKREQSQSTMRLEHFNGIELSVPGRWTSELTAGGLLLVAPEIEEDWQTNIFFEVRTDPDVRSMEQTLVDLAPNVRARKQRFTEVDRRTGRLPSGLEFGLLEYSCFQGNTKLKEWELVVNLGADKRLFVLLSTGINRREKYLPVFSAVVDSIRQKDT